MTVIDIDNVDGRRDPARPRLLAARWADRARRPTLARNSGQQTLTGHFPTVLPAGCGTLRRVGYAVSQLLTWLLVYLPLGIGGVSLLLVAVPRLSELMAEGAGASPSWTFYRDALVVLGAYFGSLLVGLVIVMTVPRLLNLAIRPNKVYRLYGFHYGSTAGSCV